MDRLAVLVPVLGRPWRVRALLDSIEATTDEAHVVFICDHGDTDEIRAINQDGRADIPLCVTGNYAEKITAGVGYTDEPLVFLAADDLTFRPGWFEAALAHMRDGVEVVGVNDLIPRRAGRERHATHFLMTRAYAERPCIDGSEGPLFTRYMHNFCDDELIGTATHRGVYAYAEESHVAHEHPMSGTAPDDETYRRGRMGFRQDRRRFNHREHLWK